MSDHENTHGSITVWLHLLKDGNRTEAVARLWASYFERLVVLARRSLRSRPRPAGDEEDLALSAFDTFVRAAQTGRFPRLDDRNDLWQVLFMLTVRKTADVIEKDATQKAGAGRVVPLSTVWAGNSDSSSGGFDPLAEDPDPAEAAAMAEGLERMLALLGDGDLKKVVVCKMEGFSSREIADRLGRSVATIERKLKAVRDIYLEAGLLGEES